MYCPAGRETFLRGKLAKWLLTAGFSGENGAVLRQVLAVGPDAPTVFRIDIAQAGEYLRRCWELQDHPYDASTPPWTQFKPLIAGDRYLYIEPAPGRHSSHHVTIDVTEMLENYQTAARAARAAKSLQPARSSSTGSSSRANGAGPSSAVSSAEEVMQLEDDDEYDQMLSPLLDSAWPILTNTGASSSTTSSAQQQQHGRPVSANSSRPTSALSALSSGKLAIIAAPWCCQSAFMCRRYAVEQSAYAGLPSAAQLLLCGPSSSLPPSQANQVFAGATLGQQFLKQTS